MDYFYLQDNYYPAIKRIQAIIETVEKKVKVVKADPRNIVGALEASIDDSEVEELQKLMEKLIDCCNLIQEPATLIKEDMETGRIRSHFE